MVCLLCLACTQKFPELSNEIQVLVKYPGKYYFNMTSRDATADSVFRGAKTINIGNPDVFFIFIAREDRRRQPLAIEVVDARMQRTIYRQAAAATNDTIHFTGSKKSGRWNFEY